MSNDAAGLRQKTRSGFLWAFAGAGAQNILQFVVLLVLARYLSADEFGVVNLSLIIVGFSALFSNMGAGPAIVQRYTLTSGHIKAAFIVSSVLGAAIGAVLWGLSDVLAHFFRMEELRSVVQIFALIFPLGGLTVVPEALLQREMRFKYLSALQVASYAAGYGVAGIGLAILDFGIWSLVGAHLVQTAIRTIGLWSAYPPLRLLRQPGRIGKRTVFELLRFGGGASLDQLGNYAALQGDNVLIGRWLGADALGIYGRAYQLAVLPATLLGQVLDKVLFSSMSKVQQDMAAFRASYVRNLAYVNEFVVPLTVYCIAFAPNIIEWVLGGAWSAAVRPFQILCLGMMFRTGYKVSNSAALALGLVYQRALRQWIYVALVIAGTLAGLRWGLPGAAFGVLAAIAIHYWNMMALCRRGLGLGWRELIRLHYPALAAAVWLGFGMWLGLMLLARIQAGSFLELVLGGGMLVSLYAALVWLVPEFMLGIDREGIKRTLTRITKFARAGNRGVQRAESGEQP